MKKIFIIGIVLLFASNCFAMHYYKKLDATGEARGLIASSCEQGRYVEINKSEFDAIAATIKAKIKAIRQPRIDSRNAILQKLSTKIGISIEELKLLL